MIFILLTLLLVWILGVWFILVTYDLGWDYFGVFDTYLMACHFRKKDIFWIIFWPLTFIMVSVCLIRYPIKFLLFFVPNLILNALTKNK